MDERSQSLRLRRIAALLTWAAKVRRDARAAIRRTGKQLGRVQAKDVWPQKRREWLAPAARRVAYSRASDPRSATRRGLTRAFNAAPVRSQADATGAPQPWPHRIRRRTSPMVRQVETGEKSRAACADQVGGGVP
jgi:hypothetical protein